LPNNQQLTNNALLKKKNDLLKIFDSYRDEPIQSNYPILKLMIGYLSLSSGIGLAMSLAFNCDLSYFRGEAKYLFSFLKLSWGFFFVI